MELHTDAKPVGEVTRWIDISEVARHNRQELGYWMILDQTVYDLTEFAELHPGGRRIIQAYAGIDATHGYARAHDRQPDVDAMREMYAIGRIRPLTFENFTATVSSPAGTERVSCKSVYHTWVSALQLAVSADCTCTMLGSSTSMGAAVAASVCADGFWATRRSNFAFVSSARSSASRSVAGTAVVGRTRRKYVANDRLPSSILSSTAR
jgi:hypothetical protein